jgi:hypothetical protein
MKAAAVSVDCTRLLLPLSDPQCTDECGWGVGHYAAAAGNVAVLEFLVEAKVIDQLLVHYVLKLYYIRDLCSNSRFPSAARAPKARSN